MFHYVCGDSFIYEFIIKNFTAVNSEQNVFVPPYLGSFFAKFIGSELGLC